MSLTTLRKLRLVCYGPDNVAVGAAQVVADLIDPLGNPAFDDQSENIVLPRRVVATADANGVVVIELAVNHGTRYRLQVIAGARVLLDTHIEIPQGLSGTTLLMKDVVCRILTLNPSPALNAGGMLVTQLLDIQNDISKKLAEIQFLKSEIEFSLENRVASFVQHHVTEPNATLSISAAYNIIYVSYNGPVMLYLKEKGDAIIEIVRISGSGLITPLKLL